MYACNQLDVDIRKENNYYNKFPVLYQNKNMFITPRNRIQYKHLPLRLSVQNYDATRVEI